jgi:hypothetical protein
MTQSDQSSSRPYGAAVSGSYSSPNVLGRHASASKLLIPRRLCSASSEFCNQIVIRKPPSLLPAPEGELALHAPDLQAASPPPPPIVILTVRHVDAGCSLASKPAGLDMRHVLLPFALCIHVFAASVPYRANRMPARTASCASSGPDVGMCSSK